MTTTTAPETDVVVDAKQPKRKSVTLTGQGEKLTVLALRRPSGAGTVFVQVTNEKTKKTQRGMTQDFGSFDEAVVVVDKLVTDAMKKGWTRRERSGGFKARPDAFTSIPTPPKGKK